jgi:hypothetical protein
MHACAAALTRSNGMHACVRRGDFTNMNGGPQRDHQFHREGLSADGVFDGYNRRPFPYLGVDRIVSAAAAQRIIDDLNALPPYSVTTVYVTFSPEFKAEIVGKVLEDGRNAEDVIKDMAGHGTHFHWEAALPD